MPASPAPADERLASAAPALARLALDGIRREYPNHIQHRLDSDDDVAPPRELHPSFYGCFDWHSAVHSHWLLVRLLNRLPELELREEILTALDESFAPEKLAAEARYLERHRSFERPYGLAWLAMLAAEVSVSAERRAEAWRQALRPVVAAAQDNFRRWLTRLARPIRSGTHSQTAFALTLLLEAAASRHDSEQERLLAAQVLRLYGTDRGASLAFEPSGEDFLSPCLGEADAVAAALREPAAFAAWLDAFLPELPRGPASDWLPVAPAAADETDGKLVHLHGLNLSRAWNLRRIAAALPPADPRVTPLRDAAERHAEAGLAAALGIADYAATHWLPTFAVYLLTADRCLPADSIR